MPHVLPRRQLAHFVAPAVVALVLAVIGPFGTFEDMVLPRRLLYWGIGIPVNWLLISSVLHLFLRRWPDSLPPSGAVVATVLVGSLPASLVVMVLEASLRPGPREVGLPTLYVFVAVLTAGITVPVWMYRRRHPPAASADAAPETADAVAGEIPFLRRIPAKLGKDLLCLGMEDHYLRIYTAIGDDLILMRLKDAEAELAGVEGMRVHRSWWVARQAVVSVKREGDRVLLALGNGLDVPVSRANIGALKAAGWLG